MPIEAPISRDQYQRQRVVGLKAKFEADRIKLLADPTTKREYLTDDQDLAIFDKLHQPSIPRSPWKISDEIEALLVIDGPRPGLTLPDQKMGNYISGLLSSLGGAIGINLYMMEHKELKPRVDSVDENRPKIIEDLADVIAKKQLIEAGEYDKDFLRRYPNFVDSLNGAIAGYEWALGRRETTGVDVRAEIDRFPNHYLRTKPVSV